MNTENQIIEWKETWRDEYIKWICGFANAQGGILIIGKNDHGEIVGLNDAKLLCLSSGLPKPVFDTGFGGLQIEFVAKPEDLKMTEKMSVKTSVKTSVKIIQLLILNSEVTIPEMAEQIGISERSIERNLQNLQKSNKIERIGPAKGGHWKVIE